MYTLAKTQDCWAFEINPGALLTEGKRYEDNYGEFMHFSRKWRNLHTSIC